MLGFIDINEILKVMNKQTSIPKFTRKNKKSQRQLKHLNSDYYIKVVNPDKKTAASSHRYTNTIKQSASHTKLRSTSSSSQSYMITSKRSAKIPAKVSSDVPGIERTRSSTILKKQHSTMPTSEGGSSKQFEVMYGRISKVLQAYQTQINTLEQKNRSLSKENKRLRAISCSGRI